MEKAKEGKIEDWIQDIVDKTKEHYAGRKVILWGKYDDVPEKIEKELRKQHQICVAFYVDSDSRKIDQVKVFSPDCLMGKAAEYYIIIPFAFYPQVKEKMKGGGYREKVDYYYFCDCVLRDEEDYYEDTHGNIVVGKHHGLKIVFSGFRSRIEIGENASFSDTSIYIHSDSEVSIGADSHIHSVVIRLENGAIVRLGCGDKLRDGSIHVYSKAILTIGRQFTTGQNFQMNVLPDTSIQIGNDCMFSWDVMLMSNDYHSIFDIETQRNINTKKEIRKKRKIVIGNHVWIGARAVILYHTRIGDGSIMGACSLVKGVIPNNCIAAGVPAKVIRENVAWSREYVTEDIETCGWEYVKPTIL